MPADIFDLKSVFTQLESFIAESMRHFDVPGVATV